MRLMISFLSFGLLALLILSSGAVAKPLQFELKEHSLGTVTEKNWPGQYLLIGIGYTSCPDICPTTVIDLATAVNALGDDTNKVAPIFISVDPNRDTVANMDMYVKYFDPKMVGLVGSQEQIKTAAKNLKATYGYSLEGKPIYPPLPKQYEVYHSAYIYFYGPDRELIDVFGYGEGGEKIGASLKRYINE